MRPRMRARISRSRAVAQSAERRRRSISALGRRSASCINHLLRRAAGEALHCGESDGVSRIGFESSAIFADRLCDAALLLIELRHAKIGVIVDVIQGERGLVIGASLLRIARSEIE